MAEPVEINADRAITEVTRDEKGHWLPGIPSPNPTGRPKRDEAQLIAQQAFEENRVEIVKALAAKLRKGDVNAFVALADRGYGKMPQTSVVTGDIDVNVTAKRSKLAEVLALLGDPA